MKTNDFSFELPERLIAQHPAARRELARLLVLSRDDGALEDRSVRELPELLPERALLVFNNSRVEPVRLEARKRPGGGAVELLVVEPFSGSRCRAMVQRARRLRTGAELELPEGVVARVVAKEPPFLELAFAPALSVAYLRRHGSVPLPPYIRRAAEHADRERYQTVYAEVSGSVAAPTAGLHFTPELLRRLNEFGHETAFVTLHVGPGTFLPVRSERVQDHSMHRERFSIPPETARAVADARASGRPVVAVGTTSVRTLEAAALEAAALEAAAPEAAPLEAAAQKTAAVESHRRAGAARSAGSVESPGSTGSPHPSSLGGSGETDLFIYPGFRFRVVDAVFTNFHTPESSLLMLVAAFGGYKEVMRAYRHAVAHDYRFYSYGDAMLIR